MLGVSVLVTVSNRFTLTNILAKLTKRSNEVYLKKKQTKQNKTNKKSIIFH